MMFHHEDKLKDLKVKLYDDSYTIRYKHEQANIHIKDQKIDRIILSDEEQGYELAFNKAHHIVVGEGNLKRDVWHFSTPDGPLPTLRCGYTVHNGENTWSSTPHPFELKPELGFEEVFLYLLDGGQPAAIQVGGGLWENGEGIAEIWRVHDRDISAIPMGYHPVVGEPGVTVSYIWAYLAKKKEWEKI